MKNFFKTSNEVRNEMADLTHQVNILKVEKHNLQKKLEAQQKINDYIIIFLLDLHELGDYMREDANEIHKLLTNKEIEEIEE